MRPNPVKQALKAGRPSVGTWLSLGSITASRSLARVPAGRHDHIKRVLDNGAHGIVVPMVNSREEAELCVAAAKYPPVGNRSVGGAVHALNFDATANDY